MVTRLLLYLLLAVTVPAAGAAGIEAHVDRNPVAVNESFLLTFEVQGDLDGEPDFSPLETFFDILSRSQSNSIRIINGDMQRTRQYQLMLMAREPGNYTIPAIAFGRDRSNTLSLEVKQEVAAADSDGGKDLLLETELDRRQAYVQGQLLYTVRLLHAVNLRSGNLTEPKFSGVEAMVEKLGDDTEYETLRNGVRYRVVERRYALFPQQSGTLDIAPTVFQGQVLEGGRFAFNEMLRARRLSSQGYQVQVDPVPADAPRPWLPAAEVKLAEEWAEDPPVFRVGEPVTRTLTLMARGLTAAQLPELPRDVPEGLKAYPDQPVLDNRHREDGVLGVRQEKIALMPTRAGRITLPAIEIAWWNTERGVRETARIPARTLEVEAAAGDTAPPPPRPEPPVTEAAETPMAPATPATQASPGFWPWLSLLLALGWAGTAAAWWWSRRKRAAGVVAATPGGSFRTVRQACKGRSPEAARDALLHWARGQWPATPPTSLGAIATRVDAGFAAALRELERRLYAPQSGDWDGSALLREAERWRRLRMKDAKDSDESALAPLYPRRQGNTTLSE